MPIITLKEAAAWCQDQGIDVKPWHLRELVKQGKIPARQTRPGGKYLIPTQKILDYFECVDGQDNQPIESTGTIRRQI